MLDRKTRLMFETLLEGKRKASLRSIREDDEEDDEGEEADAEPAEPSEPAAAEPAAAEPAAAEPDTSQDQAPAVSEPTSSLDWENVKFIGTGGIARYQAIGNDETKEVDLSNFSRLNPEDLKHAKSLFRQIDALSFLVSDEGKQSYENEVKDPSKRLDTDALKQILEDSGLFPPNHNFSKFDVKRNSFLKYARSLESDNDKKKKIIDTLTKIKNRIGPNGIGPETVQFIKNLTSSTAGSIFNLRGNKNWTAFKTLIDSFYGVKTQLDLANPQGEDGDNEELDETKEIVIDFSKSKGMLNESFVAMFSFWIKKIIQHFLDGIHIPVKVVGSERDVEAFARALSSEKNFLMKAQKYGLTDKRTYSSKYELDKAVNGFQKETGIRWPFK